MRIPRVEKTSIYQDRLILTFETGESKYFELHSLLKDLNQIEVHEFTIKDLQSIIVENGVIVFPTVKITLTGPEGQIVEAYDLDPDFTYNASTSLELSFGQIFQNLRSLRNLSQETIALKCRVDKSYISKFENDKIQLEWVSIRKLFYLGLNINLDPSQFLLPKPIQYAQIGEQHLFPEGQLVTFGNQGSFASKSFISPPSTPDWMVYAAEPTSQYVIPSEFLGSLVISSETCLYAQVTSKPNMGDWSLAKTKNALKGVLIAENKTLA
ncbi:MAG: helix-turn-helix domain-containing protein [Cyclobacteriaceae bacterium]